MKPIGGFPVPMDELPVPTKKFPAPDAPGICAQHVGIAVRTDADNSPNGGKFAKFPVIFPAVREFADQSGSAGRLKNAGRADDR